jgi:hypothetical protein
MYIWIGFAETGGTFDNNFALSLSKTDACITGT